MNWESLGHGLYLLFNGSPPTGGARGRVLGPYRCVRFAAKGIWAYTQPGEEGIRIATQAIGTLNWELGGFDDPHWGNVNVFAPDRPTSAREIEAAHGWTRPD